MFSRRHFIPHLTDLLNGLMGFLFCPWLRWGQKHSESPNVTSCYQLTRLESPPSPEEQAEGDTSSSTNSGVIRERQRRSSGLSDRLRRRFSRDTNAEAKATDRKLRSSFLPFSLKPIGHSPALINSGDFTGRLMSDRGYDSDAQFMDTPRQVNNVTEHLYDSPSIWGIISPLAQPYYETQPDELGEELAEESSIMVDGPFLGQNQMEASQLSWHPRDSRRRGPPPQGFSTSADYGNSHKRVGSPYTTGFFEHRGQYTSPNRERRQGYPGRTPISPVPYATPGDSLYGPSSNLSVRKRRQPPPRELRSETHSVHLGDMGISKRLASPSISPRVLSAKSSFSDNGRGNNTGPRNLSQQHNGLTKSVTKQSPTRNAQELTPAASNINHESSAYSRKSSISSGFSKYQFETKIFNLPDPERGSMKNPYAGASSPNLTLQSQDTPVLSPNDQQSKSRDKHEADSSVASPRADSQSNIDTAISLSRQVSVGWMSGGRRLGYGYTLVPENEKKEPEDPSSLKTCDQNSVAAGNDDGKGSPGDIEKPGMRQNNEVTLRRGETFFEISNMMHRLNFRHWSGATASSSANNVSEGASHASITSVLWGKFGYLKKGQSEAVVPVDQRPPWSHFCGVGLEQLDETQSPPKNALIPVEDNEGQLSKGLHRARSLWTKGRTLTERAHSLETRFATKIPISIRHASSDLQRKRIRVIKFKARERKKMINSLDEENPIFPDLSKRDLPANTDGTLQATERSSSDTDWADAYEDCLEIRSLPN